MTDAELRIDPLTGACVVVAPWRQQRPHLSEGSCPLCPGFADTDMGYVVPRPAIRFNPAAPSQNQADVTGVMVLRRTMRVICACRMDDTGRGSADASGGAPVLGSGGATVMATAIKSV